MIDRGFSKIDDIPVYEPSPSPSSLEQYSYTEIRAPRGHHFIVDGASPDVVIEKAEGAEKEFGSNELVKIPVFYSIAAGDPGFVSDRAESFFPLPRKWIKTGDSLFMLKVEGDSMIDVDIFDGDYVLVKKQNVADNTDIVVVALADEEATLKGYMKIDRQVLLIPKNKKYKPRKVQSEEARILGKVVGVVKPQG